MKTTFRNSLYKTTIEEVSTIINSLKNKLTSGWDGINTILLKKRRDTLAKHLHRLINSSIQSRIFPDCLKIGGVGPIYKNGNKKDMRNYKPMLAKAFEKVLLK